MGLEMSNERARSSFDCVLNSHHVIKSVHVASCLSTGVDFSLLQLYGGFPPKGMGHRYRVPGIWAQMPSSVCKGRLTSKLKINQEITCATGLLIIFP